VAAQELWLRERPDRAPLDLVEGRRRNGSRAALEGLVRCSHGGDWGQLGYG
jgi:hypothetical protein